MKKIYLSGKFKSLFALVDDEDFERMNEIDWILHEKGYAVNPKIGRMHRLINNTPKGLQTDHINGNKLDNRRENLRSCTNRLNHYNKGLRKDNRTGCKGVAWSEVCQKYEAYIKTPDKKVHLGVFVKLDDAIAARKNAERELHGDFMYAMPENTISPL
jgi:hypothetical protein